MWELKMMKEGGVIDEVKGFFSLGSEEELKELETVENLLAARSEEDRLMIFGGILEQKRFFVDAISHYKRCYELNNVPAIAHRIACCYDKLELEGPKYEWNERIF